MSKIEETSQNNGSATPETAKTESKTGDAPRSVGGKALVGAAVGIGSAAIVAALLYARKRP